MLALLERARELGDAEVDELHEVGAAGLRAEDEDVLGLEIAVDDARGVGRHQRREKLSGDGRHLLGRQLAVPLDPLGERLAVEKFHDHEAVAVGQRPEVEHLEDVVVADLAGGLRLPLEPADDVDVARGVGVEDLDGHTAADEDVLPLVHGPHAAGPDETGDAVLAVDDLSGLEHCNLKSVSSLPHSTSVRPVRQALTSVGLCAPVRAADLDAFCAMPSVVLSQVSCGLSALPLPRA